MQYENIFKVIGVVHIILAFLKLFLPLKLFRRWLLVLVLRPLRWIDVYSRKLAKTIHNINIHSNSGIY